MTTCLTWTKVIGFKNIEIYLKIYPWIHILIVYSGFKFVLSTEPLKYNRT